MFKVLASQFQTTPTWVASSVTHNGEERVLEMIRAGFWLARPYSRRLVRRSMLPLLLVWTPDPVVLDNSEGSEIQTTSFQLGN